MLESIGTHLVLILLGIAVAGTGIYSIFTIKRLRGLIRHTTAIRDEYKRRLRDLKEYD